MVRSLFLVSLVFVAACSSGKPVVSRSAAGSAASSALAALPFGWIAASTGPAGPLASWEARDESELGRTLALVRTNHASSVTYNLFWTRAPDFGDGTLEVALRADAGEIDQGGGLAWRVQDARNYYVCRFNPLESNLRVYVVENGERRQLASSDVACQTGHWYRLRVEQRGARITCALDGRELLAVEDATRPAPGGIGLWTKADARTSFSGLLRVDG